MTWKFALSPAAQTEFARLSNADANRLLSFLRKLSAMENPRDYGQAVSASWRYFADEFALVTQIDDRNKTVNISLIYSVSLDELDADKSHVFWSSIGYH
jgi:mRNA-degrading endonuclease RelE of RelBE toxin-antitoxin system